MESITIGGVEYHFPYVEEVRPLNDQEKALLTDGIKARGRVDVPVVVDEHNNVIDGHNRLRIAHALGLADVPREVLDGLTDEQKRERAAALNEERRQLTQEEIRERAARRKERVLQARQVGRTMQDIADEEGVSLVQVQRDLSASLPGGKDAEAAPPKQPEKVMGKDGIARRVDRRDGLAELALQIDAEHPDWNHNSVRIAAAMSERVGPVRHGYVTHVFARERKKQSPPEQAAPEKAAPATPTLTEEQRERLDAAARRRQWTDRQRAEAERNVLHPLVPQWHKDELLSGTGDPYTYSDAGKLLGSPGPSMRPAAFDALQVSGLISSARTSLDRIERHAADEIAAALTHDVAREWDSYEAIVSEHLSFVRDVQQRRRLRVV